MKAARPSKKTPTPSDELAATIRAELRRALGAATRRADLLGSIATQVSATTAEAFADAAPAAHRQRAHELRGVVLHALTVLLELEHINGRLETLAGLEETLRDVAATK